MSDIRTITAAFIAIGIARRIAQCSDGRLPENLSGIHEGEIGFVANALRYADAIDKAGEHMGPAEHAYEVAEAFGYDYAEAEIAGTRWTSRETQEWLAKHREAVEAP